MADSDTVGAILKAAQWSEVAFERVDADIWIGDTVDDALAFQLAIGPAGEIVRDAGALGEEKRPLIIEELRADAGALPDAERRLHADQLLVRDRAGLTGDRGRFQSLRLVVLERVEPEAAVRQVANLGGQRVAVGGVLAAGEDLQERVAAAPDLGRQPANVVLATVGAAEMSALELAQPPLEQLEPPRQLAVPHAVPADERPLIGDNLPLPVAGRAGLGGRGAHRRQIARRTFRRRNGTARSRLTGRRD